MMESAGNNKIERVYLGIVVVGVTLPFNLFAILLLLLNLPGDYGISIFAILTSIMIYGWIHIIIKYSKNETGAKTNRGDDEEKSATDE